MMPVVKRESGDNKLDLLVLYPHNLFLFLPLLFSYTDKRKRELVKTLGLMRNMCVHWLVLLNLAEFTAFRKNYFELNTPLKLLGYIF